MPMEPRSSVRVIRPGSLELTLVMEAISHRSQALVMSPRASQSTGPCSHSIHAASKPVGPRKSMMSLLCSPEMVVTSSPFCNLCLARLTLIDAMWVLLIRWARVGALDPHAGGPGHSATKPENTQL